MMTATKTQPTVLSAEHLEAAGAAAWLPPMVDGPRANRRQLPTLGELDDIEKIAWDEGYAKGQAAGLAIGEDVGDEKRGLRGKHGLKLCRLRRPR